MIINTVDRWVGFHRCNDNWYIVEDEDGNVEHLRIELPLQEKMRYMSSSSQNKDEITFYYIPYPLVMEKNKWDKIKENYMIIKVIKCEYLSYVSKWLIEDDIGGRYLTKTKPPYKVGDIIASYWHYDNYLTNVLR